MMSKACNEQSQLQHREILTHIILRRGGFTFGALWACNLGVD